MHIRFAFVRGYIGFIVTRDIARPVKCLVILWIVIH